MTELPYRTGFVGIGGASTGRLVVDASTFLNLTYQSKNVQFLRYFFITILTTFFIYMSIEPANSWLYVIDFELNCNSILNKNIDCYNVGRGIIIERENQNNTEKKLYRIIIDSEIIFQFEASKIMVGGYPDHGKIFFTFGRGRYELVMSCKDKCMAQLNENKNLED